MRGTSGRARHCWSSGRRDPRVHLANAGDSVSHQLRKERHPAFPGACACPTNLESGICRARRSPAPPRGGLDLPANREDAVPINGNREVPVRLGARHLDHGSVLKHQNLGVQRQQAERKNDYDSHKNTLCFQPWPSGRGFQLGSTAAWRWPLPAPAPVSRPKNLAPSCRSEHRGTMRGVPRRGQLASMDALNLSSSAAFLDVHRSQGPWSPLRTSELSSSRSGSSVEMVTTSRPLPLSQLIREPY